MGDDDAANGNRSTALLRAHLIAADACLLLATLWTALQPDALLESTLRPEVLAAVHLVTLGCLATIALGVCHARLRAGPAPLRSRAWDWWLLGIVQLVATGVASHMWLQTYGGVAWSAALLLLGLLVQFTRFAGPLRRDVADRTTRLGISLAGACLLAAVLLGGGLALHLHHPWLPRDWLASITAHVHLALGGFAGAVCATLDAWRRGSRAIASTSAVLGFGAGGLVCGLGVLWPIALDAGRAALVVGTLAWLAAATVPPHRERRWTPARLLETAGRLGAAGAAAVGCLLWSGVCAPAAWPIYGALLLPCGPVSFLLAAGLRQLPIAARWAWSSAIAWVAGSAGIGLAAAAHSEVGLHAAAVAATAAVALGLIGLCLPPAPPHLVSSPRR